MKRNNPLTAAISSWRRRTIATKLVMAFSLLVIAMTVFAQLYLPDQIAVREYDATRARAQTIADMTAYSVSASLVFHDSAGTYEAVQAARQNGDLVSIKVVSSSGAVFLEYVATSSPKHALATRSIIRQNDREIGHVVISLSLDELDRHIEVFKVRILLTSIIFLAVCLVAVYEISHVITRPLRGIMRAVDSVTRGVWKERTPVSTEDELGALARAFNSMLDKIQSMQWNLVEMNTGLEKRVTERTNELKREREFIRTVLDTDPNLIYVKDEENRFVLANKTTADTFGKRMEDLIGQTDDRRPVSEPEHQRYRDMEREVFRTGVTQIHDEQYMDASGATRWFATIRTPLITLEGVRNVLVISTDITQRREAEKAIRASLREKEVLLKEIHHRVKNNLQIICSLLNLQSGETPDPKIREALIASQNRVRSMAFVHEKLYRSGDLARIDFGEYLASITAELARIAFRDGVQCSVDVEEAYLGIDTAIPCGLIATELVTNALKHGFVERDSGSVIVQLHRSAPGNLELAVQDDGVGFPTDKDIRQMTSTGMTIIVSLAAQISGEIAVERGPDGTRGTTFRVTFPA